MREKNNTKIVFGAIVAFLALIVVIVISRNIIDLIYLGIVSIFILRYFIEIKRK